MPLVLRGANAYLDQGRVLKHSDVIIDDGKIIAIREARSEPVLPDSKIICLPDDYLLFPGFIDMHIHGAMGVDVMDATSDSLATLTKTLPREGVTGFLATTMSGTVQEIETALIAIHSFCQANVNQGCAQILGIHLEGPFLSPEKNGVHSKNNLMLPDLALFNHWQALCGNLIKLVTVAPELDGALEFIKSVSAQGVVASIGHTNATFLQTQKAIDAGATHATHLFNAMSPICHRQPGAAIALLLDDRVNAELIVDNVHLHPAMVQLAQRQKGYEHLLLVTDAMKAKCLKPGQYNMADQMITVNDAAATASDGTLAGSLLAMNQAVSNMQAITTDPLENIIAMASTLPAKILNLYPKKGSICEGADADIIIADCDLAIVGHVIKGEYQAINDTEKPKPARPLIDNFHMSDRL